MPASGVTTGNAAMYNTKVTALRFDHSGGGGKGYVVGKLKLGLSAQVKLLAVWPRATCTRSRCRKVLCVHSVHCARESHLSGGMARNATGCCSKQSARTSHCFIRACYVRLAASSPGDAGFHTVHSNNGMPLPTTLLPSDQSSSVGVIVGGSSMTVNFNSLAAL